MLPGKLATNGTVSKEESPITVEEKREEKKRGEGRRLFAILMTCGLGAIVLTSMIALAPSGFYGHIGSPGSTDEGDKAGQGAEVLSSALATSVIAIDGKGITIEQHSVIESAKMTIASYSDGKYDVGLQCSIDSLPLYFRGDPISILGLPRGEHTFTVVEPSSDEGIVQAFSRTIS